MACSKNFSMIKDKCSSLNWSPGPSLSSRWCVACWAWVSGYKARNALRFRQGWIGAMAFRGPQFFSAATTRELFHVVSRQHEPDSWRLMISTKLEKYGTWIGGSELAHDKFVPWTNELNWCQSSIKIGEEKNMVEWARLNFHLNLNLPTCCLLRQMLIILIRIVQ